MYCERCKKNEASVHLTEIIKSVKSEIHLCEACAREIGLNSKLSSFSLSIPDILSFLDGDSPDEAGEIRYCPSCSYTIADISAKNSLGCPGCYEFFSDEIEKIVRMIKPDFVSYHGRVPERRYLTVEASEVDNVFFDNVDDINKLRKKLDVALSNEDYETAAVIRDKMNLIITHAGR